MNSSSTTLAVSLFGFVFKHQEDTNVILGPYVTNQLIMNVPYYDILKKSLNFARYSTFAWIRHFEESLDLKIIWIEVFPIVQSFFPLKTSGLANGAYQLYKLRMHLIEHHNVLGHQFEAFSWWKRGSPRKWQTVQRPSFVRT